MDLIATRGIFGDFGRLKKGDVVKGVSKNQAEKMIKSGGYKAATAADIKAAEDRKKMGARNAKASALVGRKPAGDAVKAEIEKIRRQASEVITRAQEAAKADVDAARQEAEQAKKDLLAAQKHHADEIAKVKADAADAIAKAKADIEAQAAAKAAAAKKD